MGNEIGKKLIKSTLLAALGLTSVTAVEAVEESEVTTVVQVSTNDNTSYFRRSDGSLWACGVGTADRLGGDYTRDQYKPVLIDESDVVDVSSDGQFTAYVKSDGSLWGTGSNSAGQLGLDGYVDDNDSETIQGPAMILDNGVVDVECGGGKTFFIKEDGSLWGMGQNHDYVFSRDRSIDSTTHYLSPVLMVESGVRSLDCQTSDSIYYITENGSLWGLGDNTHGQITGHTKDLDEIFIPHQIFDGEKASFVINRPFHSLLRFDDSSSYEQKYGSIIHKNYLHCLLHLSANPDEIVSVRTAGSGTLILDTDKTLWGLGSEIYQRFGPGSKERADQGRKCLEKIEVGVIAMDISSHATFFVKDDNTLWAMGNHIHGRLGNASLEFNKEYDIPQYVASGVASVATNGRRTYYITTGGQLFGFGNNYYGRLGDGTRKTIRETPVEITFE